MPVPKIVECKLVRRTTYYHRDVIQPVPYEFTEILMTDENGVHYCSRTWDYMPDTPFNRGYHIEQFNKRWKASHP